MNYDIVLDGVSMQGYVGAVEGGEQLFAVIAYTFHLPIEREIVGLDGEGSLLASLEGGPRTTGSTSAAAGNEQPLGHPASATSLVPEFRGDHYNR